MEIILRGVRGGIAAPSLDTAFYGGNTSCVEVRPCNGCRIFLDAGTGLREAGKNLPESGEAHIFLTHAHADHVVGMWFFKPLHSPGWLTHLYLPEWLDSLPEYFFQCGLFPVPFDKLKGRVERHLVKAGQYIVIPSDSFYVSDEVSVEAFATQHPGGGLGWRVRADNAVFVYTGDHEIAGDAGLEQAMNMLRDADLAVVDAQYNRADYKPGFGHSTWEDWAEAAERANLPRLVLGHHDPDRSDTELEKVDKAMLANSTNMIAARDGLRFTLGSADFTRRTSDKLLHFLEDLATHRDKSAILDLILFKARELAGADAGTIFLAEGSELVFAYTHNDSLFPVNEAHRRAYASWRLPVSEASIAGYVASTGRIVNLPDARALPANVPYSFNDSFDRQTGFVTKSILALPLTDYRGSILGVLQLINCLGTDNTPQPFSADVVRKCRMLVWAVSGVLELSEMEKQSIYSMLRMAAVHDPAETGPHAERVGAIAAELYHVWAEKQGHGPDVIRREKGQLRLAAMLHDIGKVGVSDLVLKKPGKLTDEEFRIIRSHTTMSSSILKDAPGGIASLAHDIALHHHQKWNGTGYVGKEDEGRLAGADIPLGARITAIADVFDALVSPRCYKNPWTFEQALELLRKEAGTHFDPDLVDRMAEIQGLLHSIYDRFPDRRHDGETGSV